MSDEPLTPEQLKKFLVESSEAKKPFEVCCTDHVTAEQFLQLCRDKQFRRGSADVRQALGERLLMTIASGGVIGATNLTASSFAGQRLLKPWQRLACRDIARIALQVLFRKEPASASELPRIPNPQLTVEDVMRITGDMTFGWENSGPDAHDDEEEEIPAD